MNLTAILEEFLINGSLVSVDDENVLIGWGSRSWYDSIPEYSHVFYFPDFFLANPKPWCLHSQFLILNRFELAEKIVEKRPAIIYAWQQDDKESYTASFHYLQSLLKKNILYKGVPYISLKANAKFGLQSKKTALKKALQTKGYIYGFWENSDGILGVTPETLFTINKKDNDWLIKTEALAGTGTSESALKHPKIHKEHQWVVEGICEKINQLGSLFITSSCSVKLPSFYHLKTTIKVVCKETPDFLNLVKLLHPTPAIGAFPQENGWKWLKEMDLLNPRYRYGAPVGTIIPSHAICYAAIRNLQWFSQHMLICAGGGVILESNLEEEWQELLLKLSSIKELLHLA